MKKFLLGSVFAVLLLTGCNEEKKVAEQTAPVVTEKAVDTTVSSNEEKASEQETPATSEESKKAE